MAAERAGTYAPTPIETGGVVLSPELAVLREMLARNVHDVWAARRIAEGWSYGPARDDDRKHNPTLVPYDELPESEKGYDRDVVDATLRVVLALGGRILLPPGGLPADLR